MSTSATSPVKMGTTPITVRAVRARLVDGFARRLGVKPAEIDVDGVFNDFGLDSVAALALTTELEQWLGIEVEAAALWYYPTIAEFAAYLVEEFENQREAA